MLIRPCTMQDAPQLCGIYNPYVADTTISFEEQVLTEHEMAQRVQANTAHHPWLVAEVEGALVGYAYATRWKERVAYRHTAEATVYIRQGLAGQGHGKALYSALMPALAAQGCHVVVACIALPNEASVGLHEHMGFRKVAHFHQVGRKFAQWLDVGYWQKDLT